MAIKKVKKSAYRTRDGFVYLTKRMVVRKAAKAGQLASDQAMQVMGYVVTTQGKWVVRKNIDGSVEKIALVEDNGR